MGQYYKVAFKREGDRTATVNDRKYKGSDYVFAKLLEHGYLENKFCKAVAAMLAKGKTRLAWVGDYSEDDELRKITTEDLNYDMVWGDRDNFHEFPLSRFGYKGKYLVNWTKGVYISFDLWKKHYEKDEWPLCPFAILTAIGNGRGGGDYDGTEMDRVGEWAWDEISIEKKPPVGFKLLDFCFKEGWK
jgi:hypothetical protein